MDEGLRRRIVELLGSHKVLLFMKGTPSFPQCGFSARTVSVLKEIGVPFGTVNILQDAELREGLKEFSEWPTYPQLYVAGELVGGCDIVTEMHAKGELSQLIRGASEQPRPSELH